MIESKVSGAVDLSYLRDVTVVGVGVGGAYGIYEGLVRSGVGRLVIVDYDSVDHGNLATQGFAITDVGCSKVDVAKTRLNAISKHTEIVPVKADFLDLKEEHIADLVRDASLLLMMTDNFYAQARGNLVALRHQVPAVFAIMYERSLCAEITFTIPGVTPGCHRCAVSSRYDAYRDSPRDTTIQTCTTAFHTEYLNSAIGLLSLAILHRDRPGFLFSDWFGGRWERNLVQLRLHPTYGNEPGRLFNRVLGAIPHAFAFDAVWQKIEPEAPPEYVRCPDCGGVGDLRSVPPIESTMPIL